MKSDEIEKIVGEAARRITEKMSPREMGKLIYPDAIAIAFNKVPDEIVAEHLERYSKKELKRGQFFKVRGKYTFFMDKKAHERRQMSSQ